MDRPEHGEGVETARYHIEESCTETEFLAVAKVYAREIVSAYELSVSVSGLKWELSKRAKRRAGALKYRDETPKAIILTWEFFQT
jgi:hypothetical protein